MSPPQQPFFLLHLLLLLLPHYLFLFSSPQSPPLLQLLPADREALFDIRQSLHDLPGSSFFSNWDFSSGSEPCNTFTGVICSYDSDEEPNFLQVSTLTLGTGLVDSPGLGGTLPPSITNLTALTELVVYPGRVSGPIPAEIGFRLLRLRLLSISGNRLLGPIPSSLSNLPDLHTLDLGQNHLQGPLPPSLFSSNPNLKVLLLASNGGLCGSLPHEFSDAAKLLHVDLRSNSLTGPLPPPPASLRFLSAAFNSLSGPLSLPSPPPRSRTSSSSTSPGMPFLVRSHRPSSPCLNSLLFSLAATTSLASSWSLRRLR
ncbi:hypothetical protein HPP92_017634 [Vanilla planifolia]|uniref:Leucine-rich repeat-containing N-terminal plant-type domain-containing protein n=1 Tax=Vanilla planifolia TaxID=51239 RepID=A0A835Q8C4_VANPL|nr:hypothetical protein HPP92_017634 [Vanilla planifolia]